MTRDSATTVCVDLDGTLVRTDTLAESILQLFKYHFFRFLILPFWLLKGRVYLKSRVAEYTSVNARLLPYNLAVLDYLKSEKDSGAKLYLVTASMQKTADAVAGHLGIFDGQYGSTEKVNYKGRNKAQLLNELFGPGNYDYIGDSRADRAVWQHSQQAIVVNNPALARQVRASGVNTREIHCVGKHPWLAYLKMIRMHQWVKNLLIFFPLILSHSILDLDKVFETLTGFILFSLTASGIYVFNDLLDLNNDRTHPRKSRRALASGDVPVLHGLLVGVVLWGVALGVSFARYDFLFVLLTGYIALNFIYSTILKRLVLLDVVVLAGFYILRLIVGAVMTGDTLSFWLITFSLFIFFSLALIKRYIELAHHMQGRSAIRGRGYSKEDEVITSILGVASGLVAVLVMALYIHDTRTLELYAHADWLWMTIPALLYWISRLWMLAHRNEIGDDPISFAIRDPESYLVAVVLSLSIYLAL